MVSVSSYEEKHTREESIRSFPRMYIFVSFREMKFLLSPNNYGDKKFFATITTT
ncbi:hypothetical protein WN51_04662 [Melipona quadrifasciata]|uniref:Uncharacterized protein n=1 Tax=Melipona quadrifasciata TaxID=166423 RepID=A0A0M8ZUC3_9HYME|nr:hypothetical protein WN51_04662 [Melipona quadrifasciata]